MKTDLKKQLTAAIYLLNKSHNKRRDTSFPAIDCAIPFRNAIRNIPVDDDWKKQDKYIDLINRDAKTLLIDIRYIGGWLKRGKFQPCPWEPEVIYLNITFAESKIDELLDILIHLYQLYDCTDCCNAIKHCWLNEGFYLDDSDNLKNERIYQFMIETRPLYHS